MLTKNKVFKTKTKKNVGVTNEENKEEANETVMFNQKLVMLSNMNSKSELRGARRDKKRGREQRDQNLTEDRRQRRARRLEE